MTRTALMLYDALLGIALLFTPWSRYWQENWFLWQTGSLQSFLMSGPVRGAISGLGAAFLILAAGRLAGFAVVDEDEDWPHPPAVEPATADVAPTAADKGDARGERPESKREIENGPAPEALMDPRVAAVPAATAVEVRER